MVFLVPAQLLLRSPLDSGCNGNWKLEVVVGHAVRLRSSRRSFVVSRERGLLLLKNASGLQTAPLGHSMTAKAGQAVMAIGNAGGVGGTPSAVTGAITRLNQSITVSDDSGGSEHLSGLIQTNAPIQPGDSGGPLVNNAGAGDRGTPPDRPTPRSKPRPARHSRSRSSTPSRLRARSRPICPQQPSTSAPHHSLASMCGDQTASETNHSAPALASRPSSPPLQSAKPASRQMTFLAP
jgi:Trypsin-like peptidase domain